MSLAEYTRVQKHDAKISKKNLKNYLENAEGILSPDEINANNKPVIDSFAANKDEPRITQAEALAKAETELTSKLNELTQNDMNVTNFIIKGLDENEIMGLESIYDDFISSYLLKYGKTQKTKEFFIQASKAYLKKNYPDMLLYTNYDPMLLKKKY